MTHAVHVILLALILKSVEAPNFDQVRESVTQEDQRSFIKINVLLETPPSVVAGSIVPFGKNPLNEL